MRGAARSNGLIHIGPTDLPASAPAAQPQSSRRSGALSGIRRVRARDRARADDRLPGRPRLPCPPHGLPGPADPCSHRIQAIKTRADTDGSN
jgi:hypothetical protein